MGLWRTNPLSVDSIVATLISYPIGLFMAKALPKGKLNPGPFNIKEHVLIFVLATAGASGAYGIDNVIVQKFRTFMEMTIFAFWSHSLGSCQFNSLASL